MSENFPCTMYDRARSEHSRPLMSVITHFTLRPFNLSYIDVLKIHIKEDTLLIHFPARAHSAITLFPPLHFAASPPPTLRPPNHPKKITSSPPPAAHIIVQTPVAHPPPKRPPSLPARRPPPKRTSVSAARRPTTLRSAAPHHKKRSPVAHIIVKYTHRPPTAAQSPSVIASSPRHTPS